MRALAIAAIAAVMLAASPVQAQDRDAEISALRDRLEAQETAIRDLQAQLRALRGADAAPVAPSPPPAAPPAPRTEVPTVVLSDLPTGAPPLQGGSGERTWQVAPPGPIDRPLLRAPDGRAAAFELATATGGGRASFALTQSRDQEDSPTAAGVAALNHTTSLTLSAPLAKDGDTPFATLDGLATGLKLQFEYTQSHRRIRSQDANDANPIVIRARARCAAARPAYAPGCEAFDTPFRRMFLTPDEALQYDSELARETLRSARDWSVRAALGYDEFAFYPVPTLVKTTTDEVSWSIGGGVTVYPFDFGSLAFDLDYERSYDAAKSVTACPVPAPGATTVTCVPGPLTAPEQVDKFILASELRYLWPVSQTGLVRNLGLAPRLEFDLESDELAFDLPIYFAADAKDGLNGGVRLGYTTEEDEFILGVFIGKSFSIFR